MRNGATTEMTTEGGPSFFLKSDNLIQRYTIFTTMQIKLFTIPLGDNGAAQKKMNTFLKAHNILEIEQKLISNDNGACCHLHRWCQRFF